MKASTGALWNVGFALYRDLLQFGVLAVLSRLLTPVEYGQAGLVLTILGFLGAISVDTFIAHAIQVRRDDEVHYQDHFTAGVVIQLAIFVITNTVAFILSYLPAYSDVSHLVHIMSVTFLIALPRSFRVKMLEREMKWKRIRVLHGLGMLASRVCAIVIAVLGGGVYALLVPSLIISIPYAIDLFSYAKWRPDWSWDKRRYAPALRFGLIRGASGLIGTGQKLLESSAFVAMVGLGWYGVYGRVTALSQLFCFRVTFLLFQSIYPMLTRLEPGSASQARVAGLTFRCVAWFVIPIGAIFAILAEPVILTIYGVKWTDVVPFVPVGMAAGVLQALFYAAYTLVLSNQGHRACLLLDTAVLVGTGICLGVLLPMGISQYLAGMTATHGALLGLVLLRLLRERVLTTNAVIDAALAPLLALTITMVFCEGLLSWSGANRRQLGIAIGYGILFGIAYAVSLRILFPRRLKEIIGYLPGGRRLNQFLGLSPAGRGLIGSVAGASVVVSQEDKHGISE